MARGFVASRRSIRAVLCLALALRASPAEAQASLVGAVRDSAGRAISGADVSIEALGRTVRSDGTGHYLLTNVAPGMRLVRVRQLGFAPVSRLTQVSPGENTLKDFVLMRLVVKLDTVTTRDHAVDRNDLALREFEENRKVGLGHFVTRAQLAKLGGLPLSDAIQSIPGTRIASGNGSAAYVVSSRGPKSMQNNRCPAGGFEDGSPRGASCSDCFPPVYVDGVPLGMSQVININRFTPDQVEAIEVYAGPAQTPAKYAGLGSQCGVVIIHTRRP